MLVEMLFLNSYMGELYSPGHCAFHWCDWKLVIRIDLWRLADPKPSSFICKVKLVIFLVEVKFQSHRLTFKEF